jgi:hypothetical protein
MVVPPAWAALNLGACQRHPHQVEEEALRALPALALIPFTVLDCFGHQSKGHTYPYFRLIMRSKSAEVRQLAAAILPAGRVTGARFA